MLRIKRAISRFWDIFCNFSKQNPVQNWILSKFLQEMYFQIIKAHPVQISSISHMREKWEAYPIRVCSNCSFRSVYFLRVSKVWSMWHPASVGRLQNKECYFMFPYNFLGFLLLLSFFFITKFLFLWFAFFLFIFFWLVAVLLLNWFLRISQFLHWYREL